MDPTKKISFGFSKLSKKPNVILNKTNEIKPENDIQLIQCLEENSIKLIKEDKPETPLVIPAQENRTSAALASLRLRQAILSGNLENENISVKSQSKDSDKTNSIQTTVEKDAEENLEQKAARELLEEIRNNKNIDEAGAEIAVPLKPDELPLDGAEEPNIEDYEKIPISQFGLAMLRGMGWKDEQKKDDKFDSDQPILRPKGMGLGADKVLKAKPLLVAPEKNEKLEIRKNSYVRILGGKHKDLYGQIEGLDDHAGRVIIKLALGGSRESMNEFLVQPVSKGEYIKYGKVINSAKYEEYKKKQESEQKEQIQVKYEKIKEENETGIDDVKDEIKKEKRDKHYHESSSSSRRNYEDIEGNKSRSHQNDRRESENKYRSRENERSSGQCDKRRENSEESGMTSEDSLDYHHHHHRSKKKSSKSRKEKSKDRNRRYYSDSNEENDKRHKKKTKKSKKEKARSRSRGRR